MSAAEYWNYLTTREPIRPNVELVKAEVGPCAAALMESRWKRKVCDVQASRYWNSYQTQLQNLKSYGVFR